MTNLSVFVSDSLYWQANFSIKNVPAFFWFLHKITTKMTKKLTACLVLVSIYRMLLIPLTIKVCLCIVLHAVKFLIYTLLAMVCCKISGAIRLKLFYIGVCAVHVFEIHTTKYGTLPIYGIFATQMAEKMRKNLSLYRWHDNEACLFTKHANSIVILENEHFIEFGMAWFAFGFNSGSILPAFGLFLFRHICVCPMLSSLCSLFSSSFC